MTNPVNARLLLCRAARVCVCVTALLPSSVFVTLLASRAVSTHSLSARTFPKRWLFAVFCAPRASHRAWKTRVAALCSPRTQQSPSCGGHGWRPLSIWAASKTVNVTESPGPRWGGGRWGAGGRRGAPCPKGMWVWGIGAEEVWAVWLQAGEKEAQKREPLPGWGVFSGPSQESWARTLVPRELW